MIKYKKFNCLNQLCWYASKRRQPEWKVYLTPKNIKLECAQCGFVIMIPLNCQTCGAIHSISGNLKGSEIPYGTGDFMSTTIPEDDEYG